MGVEEELLVVGTHDRRPSATGGSLVAGIPDAEADQFEAEFKKEQAELGSAPTESLDDLSAELRSLRRRMLAAAEEHGAQVAALATSPFKVRPTATEGERYARMTERFGLLARQQLTCGQHVHVSIESRDEGVAVLDRIRPWLHVLTALSVNSPFWHGSDSGYGSYRTIMWSLWPTAGPTDTFGSVAGYEAAIDELLGSGAAMDTGMIYFDARLSARYPTVEIRVADVCTDVADAVLLAGLARALVDTTAAAWRDGQDAPVVSSRLLHAASWRAARYGLSGDLADPLHGGTAPAWTLVDALLGVVGPALAANGDTELVASGMTRLREHGTGADWQRRSYARRQSLADVVDDAVRRTADQA